MTSAAMAPTTHHFDESSLVTPTSSAFAVDNLLASLRSDGGSDINGVHHRAATPPLGTPRRLVRAWGVADIESFLKEHGCGRYSDLFHQNDIDGNVLLDLDMAALKAIGINRVGDRIKILTGIRNLRKRAAVSTPPSATLPRGLPSVAADFDSVDGSPQARLSTGTKRRQDSRPPPLNLHGHTSRALTDGGGSPTSQSVTPRSFHPVHTQHQAKVHPSVDMTKSLSHDMSALRPQARAQTSTHPFAASRKDAPRDVVPRSELMPRSDSLPRIPTRAPLDHRHVVKFVYSESSKSMGSTSKVIDLGNCSSGVQILETVLKKFGIQAKAMGDMDGDDDQLEVGGWGVYIEDELNRALSDSRLLDVCHDPEWSHERGRQLILRRRIQANRKNMGQYLGDSPPPSLSPNALSHFTVVRSGSGTEESRANNKKVNRASMVSIMSGLDPSPSSSTARAPSVGTTKMPGFRPPSELISTHLAQYFPSARKRDLEKTVRQSMLRLSQGDRQALRSLGTSSPFSASVESVSSPNRRGRPPSTRTVSSSTILEEEETGDEASTTESHPPLLPPFESSGVSLVDSFQEYQPGPSFRNTIHPGRSSSRISVLSTPRNRSDSTSLLTVDEITAEVENRRSSLATTLSPTDSLASDEELTDWESDEEEDEEDEDEVEAEVGRNHHALTSNGSTRSIRWIKGALVGAGSFGSVFLGMDTQSGLLMAVKQVERPTGDELKDEKKRNMVDALEREIELLKGLKHPNIVEYLDSASDGNHLYIFLEYVPGGSVAALLLNYGTFEEGLVRNFVRQTLNGLKYLHDQDIIHRDIKGANILVDNKGGIKISDFGISKKTDMDDGRNPTGHRANRVSLKGSVYWMAPEVVKQTAYTLKADIWSVGCLVVEMFTGIPPFGTLNPMQAIFKIGSAAGRPDIPNDISSDAVDFLQRTFEHNYEKRPSAGALLEHPFIVGEQGGGISLEAANATLSAVAAARKQPMPGLSGLGLGMKP